MPRMPLIFAILCGTSLTAAADPPDDPPIAFGTTTIQMPVFGVAVDADGVLTRETATDTSGKLRAKQIAAAKQSLPSNVVAPSQLRKISLIRLERAIEKKLQAGESIDDVMRHLAGLLRVRYVFFYPKTKDIVIAGPAEGWAADALGRVVGIQSQRPTLRLDDLAVALRAYPPRGPAVPWLGCSIGPTSDALKRVRAFQRTIPRSVSPNQKASVAAGVARGLRNAMGMTVVSVFGISPKTHFAQVLVEADYRMKLMGIGLEPVPVKMMTFLDALRTGSNSSYMRWWFTPNYECVKVSQDGLAMQLVGQGVELHGEHMVLQPDGKLAAKKGSKPTRPSKIYTSGFTRLYPQIAARRPVYAEMRNLIDMSVAASFIRQRDYYGRAGWTMQTLGDESAVPTQTHQSPKYVAAAVTVVWKGSRMLAPSGGVSIQPAAAIEAGQLIPDEDGAVQQLHQRVAGEIPAERWWWD